MLRGSPYMVEDQGARHFRIKQPKVIGHLEYNGEWREVWNTDKLSRAQWKRVQMLGAPVTEEHYDKLYDDYFGTEVGWGGPRVPSGPGRG